MKVISKDNCEKCGAGEVESLTPRTVYSCGSSDYDKRPNTFKRGEMCSDEIHFHNCRIVKEVTDDSCSIDKDLQ